MKIPPKEKIIYYTKKAFLYGFASLIVFFLAIYIGVFGKIPSKDELAAIKQESATQIYSADGQVIGKIFAKNRTHVDSAEMPQHLLDALVATEDKRFYEHNGIDYKSYGRVLIKSLILRDDAAGGGSTITQQLAKNLYGRPNYWFLTMPISKIKEAIIARRLEKVYSKHEILVLYFNTVPFGENTWGIEAATSRFFNIEVRELSISQSATLVGMLKANTAFNPRMNPEAAESRRNVVLNLMKEQGFLDSASLYAYNNVKIDLDYTNYDLYNPSGHFVYKVTQDAQHILDEINKEKGTHYDLEKDGLEITTTLNYQLQLFAVDAAKAQLIEKQKTLDKELENSKVKNTFYSSNEELAKDKTEKFRNVFWWDDSAKKPITRLDSAWMHESLLSAAVLAIDPKSGEVLVWVGGNNFRTTPYDLVIAERQPASAFKPIVYAAALEKGFTKCDYFSNEAKMYPEFLNWRPENADGETGGDAAMWYALSKSLNLPTVDLYMKTGYQQVARTSTALGLILPNRERPAFALGSRICSLKDLTRAYAAFANNGIIRDLTLITEIKDARGNVIYKSGKSQGRKSVSQSTAQDITKMLITAVREGTGRRLGSYLWTEIAGKTGTSQNYSDAWFMSYTKDIVCGVWVGAMSPKIHFRSGGNGSGSSLALPIAGKFYKQVLDNSVLRKRYLTGLNNLQLFNDSTDTKCAGLLYSIEDIGEEEMMEEENTEERL